MGEGKKNLVRMFDTLIWVMVTGVYTHVKINQIVH